MRSVLERGGTRKGPAIQWLRSHRGISIYEICEQENKNINFYTWVERIRDFLHFLFLQWPYITSVTKTTIKCQQSLVAFRSGNRSHMQTDGKSQLQKLWLFGALIIFFRTPFLHPEGIFLPAFFHYSSLIWLRFHHVELLITLSTEASRPVSLMLSHEKQTNKKKKRSLFSTAPSHPRCSIEGPVTDFLPKQLQWKHLTRIEQLLCNAYFNSWFTGIIYVNSHSDTMTSLLIFFLFR